MTKLEKELTIKITRLEDDCKAYNFTQHTLQERIKELEATNKNISNECHKLVDTLEKKQNECNQLLKDKSDLQDLNNNLINQHSKLFAEKEQLSQDNFFQKSRISDLESQIEEMKRCFNCKYRNKFVESKCGECEGYSKWEIQEND